MVGWQWFAALLVGVTLAQLVLYYRLSRDADRPDGGSREGAAFGPGGAVLVDADGDGGNGPDDARICPHCGAENDTDGAFEYCCNCVQSLP